MLIFSLQSDVGEKLWNSVNNCIHDIVAELQQPKLSKWINNAH